jgi:hypothetical protein
VVHTGILTRALSFVGGCIRGHDGELSQFWCLWWIVLVLVTLSMWRKIIRAREIKPGMTLSRSLQHILLDREIKFPVFRELNFQQEVSKARDLGLIECYEVRASLSGEPKGQIINSLAVTILEA